jgi:hypothetical protein
MKSEPHWQHLVPTDSEDNMQFTKINKAVSIVALTAFLVAGATAQKNNKRQTCQSVGGMLMTNLGAIDASTTMGPVTGDLKGSVSGTVVSTEVIGNNLVFHIQHHWVTESGDTLSFDQATAISTAVATGLYAIVTYPVHLSGGTGKFAQVTGDFTNIGEVDLNSGQIVLRYSGQLCSPKGN